MSRRGTDEDASPDPLELIARFLVPGSYRVPVEGRGSGSRLTASDVAAAIGYMEDDLQVEKQSVIAVSTRAGDREIARLAMTAYRRVVSAVRQQRPPLLDLSRGEDRWRMRIVVYDAAHELVWPERRRPLGELARAAKMRKETYLGVYRCASGTLQAALNAGRSEFCKRLWGRG